MRSKRVNLGFVVIDTRTGEYLSPVWKVRGPARDHAKALYAKGYMGSLGVHTLQAYVPESWKRGDSLEGLVDYALLEKLKDVGGAKKKTVTADDVLGRAR